MGSRYDWPHVFISVLVIGASFAVLFVRVDMASQAWLQIGLVTGHWFTRVVSGGRGNASSDGGSGVHGSGSGATERAP